MVPGGIRYSQLFLDKPRQWKFILHDLKNRKINKDAPFPHGWILHFEECIYGMLYLVHKWSINCSSAREMRCVCLTAHPPFSLCCTLSLFSTRCLLHRPRTFFNWVHIRMQLTTVATSEASDMIVCPQDHFLLYFLLWIHTLITHICCAEPVPLCERTFPRCLAKQNPSLASPHFPTRNPKTMLRDATFSAPGLLMQTVETTEGLRQKGKVQQG